MMKRFAAVALAALSFGALQAQAQSSPVVVELFTSQGCSSCPPADRLMHELAEREDVIALALHVDYWDYIGWKDEFADPENTVRQKAYAHLAGRRMIYTPQMIINGKDDVVGARSMELAELIMKHGAATPKVALTVERSGDVMTVSATPIKGLGRAALDVHLVRFMPEKTVKITRGENAGKTISYANIVADWQVIGQWDGNDALALSASLGNSDPVAIIIQEQGPGAILAAAKLD